ncbi:MAG TPA: SOS response-associated peptidase, partial [Candidatus Marinimicrobia bacterium]|nr:SOS response-associated peptidase [Candidatus Neomarinimicrobiota bacterium]
MCGRKTLTKGKIEIMEELFVDEWEDDFDWEPSYNIAPTQISPVLLN